MSLKTMAREQTEQMKYRLEEPVAAVSDGRLGSLREIALQMLSP